MLRFLLLIGLFGCSMAFAQQTEFGTESESASYRNMPFFLGQKDGKIYTIRITGYSAGIYTQLLRSDAKAALGAMIVGVAKFSNDAPFNTQRLYFGQNSRVFLEIYDEALRQVSSRELDLEDRSTGDPMRMLGIEMIGGQLYAFSYQEANNGESNRLLAHSISEDGQIERPGAELISYNTQNHLISGRKSHTFRVEASPDQQHFMVAHHELRFPKNQKADKFFKMAFFDNKLSQQWSVEFSPKFPVDEAELIDMKISNNGDAACVFKYRNPDKEGPDDLYTLFTYLKSLDRWEEFSLKIPGKFNNDILLQFGSERLFVSGFFSGRGKSSAEGYFYREIDTQTGSVVRDIEDNFSREMLSLALGKNAESTNGVISNFHMRHMVPKADGGVVLVAERYFILYSNNAFEFRYDDAFMIRLDADGRCTQTAMVAKTQNTADDGGLFNSFCVISNEQEMVFIYNANRKDPNNRMSNPNRASVYCTRIPYDGSAQATTMLFNGKEAETVAVPKVFLQESPTAVVFYNYKRGNFKYARVKF